MRKDAKLGLKEKVNSVGLVMTECKVRLLRTGKVVPPVGWSSLTTLFDGSAGILETMNVTHCLWPYQVLK